MQVVKEGRRADIAFQMAKKLGKEKLLQDQISFPNLYQMIESDREKELWRQVIGEMNQDDRKNHKASRMAILDT